MTADIRVGDVMVRNIPIADPDQSVHEAAKIMKQEKVSALIVVSENDNPMGIITERDFVHKIVAENKDILKTKVRDIMSTPLVSVTPETTLEEASVILKTHRIKRLPVINKKTKRLVGILSVTTLISVYPELIEFAKKEVELRAFGHTLDEINT